MKDKSPSLAGCRTTEQGVLIKFSDGEFYLFDTSFLLAKRDALGERIPRSSAWLEANWKKKKAL